MAKRMPVILKNLVVRIYTLVVMVIVLLAGYAAVNYLYRSIFLPGRPPQKILEWQAVTEAERLQKAEPSIGITEPAGRAPLAHYHAVDRWFQPDLRTGCISAGCHEPVPHRRSKELRAFANLHATFISCEVCHTEHADLPAPAVWVDLNTGRPQSPPAILQLSGLIRAATQPADLVDDHAEILELLGAAIAVVGRDPVLDHLALRLETARPDSPVWRRAIEQLRGELPNHARGNYGAKIAPATANTDPQPLVSDFGDLAEQYFDRTADAARRDAIHDQIHQDVIAAPEGCLPCHRPEARMLDFQALGYSAGRIDEFTGSPVVGMMEPIRAGQPFRLPLAP